MAWRHSGLQEDEIVVEGQLERMLGYDGFDNRFDTFFKRDSTKKPLESSDLVMQEMDAGEQEFFTAMRQS